MIDPDALGSATAWPFEEARKLVARLERTGKKEVVFETGYGPSGLPHIGTFGEVARTTMVRNAFRALTNDRRPHPPSSPSPTTWTACARCPTTCRTRSSCAARSACR